MVNQTISHFKILSKLGEGGMGVVFKAEDTKLGRTVAIKFLPQEIASQEEAKKRFKIEAKAAAALNHPNIATIHQIEETDDHMFIVMEYVEGQNLQEVVQAQGTIPIEEAIDYAIQIAAGLQAAHQKGIIHRDIKSANIMRTENGHIKIMDFGLAKLPSVMQFTKTGTTIGTIAYLSPEQAHGGVAVDHRTDIWSFGMVIYEMLAGQLPFRGDYEMAVMYAIMNKDPEPLSGLKSGIPNKLSNIVHKALQKNPEKRYKSTQDVILDLKRVLRIDSESILPIYDSVGALPKPAVKVQSGHISPKGERRQVAIVISNLTGYDSLIENLEPEEVNYIMESIGNQVTQIVNKHLGLVNQFSEDEIVLLFGVPITHEDDLNRAVGSALELHKLIRELNKDLGDRIEEKIQIHTGIDAGLVVVQPRDGSNRRFKLTGEPKQITSRLAAEANEDEILISSKNHRLIKPFFDAEPSGKSFIIKGRSRPVESFVIKGDSGFHTRFEVVESAALSELVGREKELHMLNASLNKVIKGNGQFVTIIGEAGLGKSRLIYEFRNQLEQDISLIQGTCQSYGNTIPYFPFRALLRELLNIVPENIGEKQVETVVSRILGIDPHLEAYLALFLQLLSMDSAKYPLPDLLDSGNIQQLTVKGVSAILTLAANKNPLVILLDDWHWVDDESHNILKQLSEMISGFPLCLVVTHRPEVAFEWGNPANHTQIQLAPLEASCSAGIVKSILGAESLSDELTALIHEKTDGNPFFVEELSQTLHEGGAIKVEGQKIILTESRSQIHLPHTIQAVIRSRLDRLNADSLEALRVASVIGREFTESVLKKALTDQVELDNSLKTLRELGLIRQIRVLPEATFRFKHALTQEVAYESLLKRQRKPLHALIGEALEQSYGDRLEEHAVLLMDHFGKAENWEKAIHYGCIAADDLMMKSHSVALNILEKVERWISKLPEDPQREKIRIDVLLKMERTCEHLGYVKRQKEIIDRLLMFIQSDDINRAEVYIRLGDLLILSNRLDEAAVALMEAHRLSKELSHEDTERRVLRSIGYLEVHKGRDNEAAEIIRQVIKMGTRKGTPDVLVQDLNSLFTILMRLGDFDEAKKCVDDALELYDQISVYRRTIYINFMAGSYYRHIGDYDKAIRYFTTMVQTWEETGYSGRPTVALLPLADIYLIQGNAEEALRCYEKAVDMSRTRKIASELAIALYALGKALVSFGTISESLPHLEEAAVVYKHLQDSENETRVLGTIADVLEKDGRYSDAFATWKKVREMGEQAEDLRIKLNAVKGMAAATRNLTDGASQALKYYKEAYKFAEKLLDQSEQGEILNTMGIIEWQRGRYKQALGHFDKAFKIFLEKEDKVHAGFMLNSMATTLIKLNRYEQALNRLKEAIQIHKQANQPLLEGHALALRGDIYLNLKQLGKAKKAYETSLKLRQEISDRKGEGWMLLQLAKVFKVQGLVEKNKAYAENALAIANEGDDIIFLNEVQAQLK